MPEVNIVESSKELNLNINPGWAFVKASCQKVDQMALQTLGNVFEINKLTKEKEELRNLRSKISYDDEKLSPDAVKGIEHLKEEKGISISKTNPKRALEEIDFEKSSLDSKIDRKFREVQLHHKDQQLLMQAATNATKDSVAAICVRNMGK